MRCSLVTRPSSSTACRTYSSAVPVPSVEHAKMTSRARTILRRMALLVPVLVALRVDPGPPRELQHRAVVVRAGLHEPERAEPREHGLAGRVPDEVEQRAAEGLAEVR